MSIVITSIGGFRNRGVEALTLPMIDELRLRFPKEEIIVLTNTPDYNLRRVSSRQVRFENDDLCIRNWGRAVRLRRAVASLRGREFYIEPDTQAATIIRDASLVIAAGGDVFSSDYRNLKGHLIPLKLAQRHHVPVVFLAHSIGPFQTKEEADAWTQIAQNSLLITARESLSYRYVLDELGIRESIVKQTADPAFLLSVPPGEKTTDILRFYGVKPSQPIIALAVSQGISRFGGVEKSAHFLAWQRVIANLLKKGHDQLIFVPHVQSANVYNDDRIVATELIESFNYDRRLSLIGGDHSAAEFKGIIAACDLVVAERMHAAIAGLSTATCTFVVGYSVKAEGIMKDMLSPALPYNEFLIPVKEFVQEGVASELINSAWERRDEVVTQLSQVLTDICDRSRYNFNLIDSMLASMQPA
jgi:colanic acid/amylovoran biosynthesis protein